MEIIKETIQEPIVETKIIGYEPKDIYKYKSIDGQIFEKEFQCVEHDREIENKQLEQYRCDVVAKGLFQHLECKDIYLDFISTCGWAKKVNNEDELKVFVFARYPYRSLYRANEIFTEVKTKIKKYPAWIAVSDEEDCWSDIIILNNELEYLQKDIDKIKALMENKDEQNN